jgi:hypothetical protein
MDDLREMALEAYDRYVDPRHSEVAVDGHITKAPCGGEKASRSPSRSGKAGHQARIRLALVANC